MNKLQETKLRKLIQQEARKLLKEDDLSKTAIPALKFIALEMADYVSAQLTERCGQWRTEKTPDPETFTLEEVIRLLQIRVKK